MSKKKSRRGGAREGAGRPTDFDETMRQHPVSLAQEHLDMVEAWADDFELEGRAAQLPAVVRAMMRYADRWRRRELSKRPR